MAEFVKVWRRRHEVVSELEELVATAAEAAPHENHCAALVQRHYRGSIARRRIREQSSAARSIQRVVRGQAGRLLAHRKRVERETRQEEAVYHYYATLMQKAFRGYYSRRYLHDFHARKAYISTIQAKSEDLRNQLAESMNDQVLSEQGKAEMMAREEFAKVTQNLHHLVSTAVTPGIYNPPYAADDEVPTAFNVPIEEHLRAGSKHYVRTQRRKKRPPSYAGADYRKSLQASSAYNAVEEARREEARYSKLRMIEPISFRAGGKVKPPSAGASISTGTKYLEPHLAGQAERVAEHSEEHKAKRVADKPFHTSVTRNREFGAYAYAKGAVNVTGRATLASEHLP